MAKQRAGVEKKNKTHVIRNSAQNAVVSWARPIIGAIILLLRE